MNEDYCVIDIETASAEDISHGVVKYAKSPYFRILCLAYKINDDDIKFVDNFNSSKIAPELPEEIVNFDGYFVAHNWFFEYVCLNVAYKGITEVFREAGRWLCTASLARYFGIDRRASLDIVSERLGLGKSKIIEGRRLIAKYSILHDKESKFEFIRDEERQVFEEYNKRDVELTAEIFYRLYPKWPEFERRVFDAHKKIALHGVPIDVVAAQKLASEIEKARKKCEDEAKKMGLLDGGGVLILTSPKRFAEYVNSKFNLQIKDTRRSTLEKYAKHNPDLKRLIEIRKVLTSRAPDKAQQILERVVNNRIYDAFVYCGAHTGRWASWGVNFFNFSRESLRDNEYDALLAKESLTLDEIVKMQRGMIKPTTEHNVFAVFDFKSIELQLLLYCVNDKDQLSILEKGGSIYKSFGQKAFGYPIEKGSKEYQIAKAAVLGLCYGAGAAVFAKLADINVDLSRKIYKLYITENYRIVNFWKRLYSTFRLVAIENGRNYRRLPIGSTECIITKTDDKKGVKIILPNGFEIFYPLVLEQQMADNEDALECSFDGGKTMHKIWGGLLTENLMQSLCRQLLADSLVELTKNGFKVVLHVYDEIVVEGSVDDLVGGSKLIEQIITKERDWLPNFKPQVESFISRRWAK